MSDIRKWFMKKHDKDNGIATKPGSSTKSPSESVQTAKSEQEQGDHESAGRKKTSKYFSSDNKKEKEEKKVDEVIGKRKFQTGSSEMHSDAKPPPRKKVHKIEEDDDDDFVETAPRRADVTPNKKLKSGTGRGIVKKSMDVDGSDEEDYSAEPKSRSKSTGSGRGRAAAKAPVSGKGMVVDESDGDDDPDIKDIKSSKSAGRGRGGRASTTAAPSGGRGRGGGGRGGYMNFADRKDPPHKGEKEIPEGSPDCLANLTFVISGTLDSLEREEAEDLIKRHGGRVTGSVSKKTNYLLCDEDIGGRKSAKAKELGTGMLTEDGLFDMIRRSKKTKSPKLEESPKPVGKVLPSPSKMYTTTPEKRNQASNLSVKGSPTQRTKAGASPLKPKTQSTVGPSLSWPEKYRPKTPNDIIGNQSLVKQLHDWLQSWSAQFMGTGSKSKGKKPNDAGAKKAVLLSGTPGIGKTTAARLVSQMLGFNTIEVNASDSRGKANAQIGKGIGGSTANTMKELINNEALSKRNMDRSQHPKTVLIMDEVDGMSAGDRGGVADLISSIKISKIPIICICNDRYSQKLKSLVNYCLMLNFRKPTKQQMAKRLLHIASAEGIKVNEIALEELAERVNGDMRLAVNQLQYMSLSMSVIKYDDIRQRLQTSSKDEDISPFTAVDKLFGFNSGKLRMDERIDLSMSDPDLVPLLIQENYINYKPSAAAKDDSGVKRMALLARAAESIADGDIINVQIRRYRQWQLFQSSSVASSIIPASLLHGQRETLEQGERNFNRFGGWLGKNSTMRKNYRILEDLHVHILASRESYLGRTTLRLDYCTLLLKQMTDTLRVLPKDEAVDKVVEFMDTYSISQEDFDTIIEVSKFQGHPSAMEGIPPAVKAALTKAYKNGSSSRVIRTADMITLPGIKKPVKKRVAAMLEPEEGSLGEDNGDAVEENVEDNNSSDSEDESSKQKKLTADLQSLNSKSVQVQMELKGVGSSSGVKKASGRGKGSSSQAGEKKEGGGRGGRGGSPAAASTSKRKR